MNAIIQPASAATAPQGWKVDVGKGRSLHELSRQWISRRADEKFLDIDSLVRTTQARAERTRTIKTANRGIEILAPEITDQDTRISAETKKHQLTFGLPDGTEVAPTHWAFNQLAGLAKVPGTLMRELPSVMAADVMQYRLRCARAEDVKLYADDLEAMAITGPDYGRIFNWEVAEAVMAATASSTGDHRWKVPGRMDWGTRIYDPLAPVTIDSTTLFANDRGVFMFLCQDLAPIEIGKLADGSPDLVFRGFYVTNSEVGAGALKLGAMYLRAICDNRILWGVEAFEEMTMRHTKYAPGRFLEEARPALESFANGSTTKLIEGVRAAKEAKVADTKAEALDWLAGRNVARKRALAIFDRIVAEERQGDEDERPVSAWELAQGMTAAARDETNFDTRMDLEVEAKRLLDRVA